MVIVRWAPPELDATMRAAALGEVSLGERARYERTPEAQRDSFLVGRMLLRDALREAGVTASTVITAVCPDCGGDHGRPVLEGSTLGLSVSRCATAVVVAVSVDGRAVGIDVEEKNAGPEKLAAIEKLTGASSVGHWTAIEAVLKADGRGLRVDPGQVWVRGGLGGVTGRPARYRLVEYEFDPGLQVTVAESVS